MVVPSSCQNVGSSQEEFLVLLIYKDVFVKLENEFKRMRTVKSAYSVKFHGM